MRQHISPVTKWSRARPGQSPNKEKRALQLTPGFQFTDLRLILGLMNNAVGKIVIVKVRVTLCDWKKQPTWLVAPGRTSGEKFTSYVLLARR